MVTSLTVNIAEPPEQFTFVLRSLESALEYSAKLSRGSAAMSRHDTGPLSEDDVKRLLQCMNATEESEGGNQCRIELLMSDDERVTTAFPTRRLLEDTVVGRVYDRLRESLGQGPTAG